MTKQQDEYNKSYAQTRHGASHNEINNPNTLQSMQGSGSYKSSRNSSSGCFIARTRVLTPTGWSEIAKLDRGDEVSSFDCGSGLLVTCPVLKVLRYRASQLWNVRLASGEVLTTTKNHSFLTQRGWITTKALNTGEKLRFVNRAGQISLNCVAEINRTKHEEPVFNLRTGRAFNFIAEGLVAHNFTHLRRLRMAGWSLAEIMYESSGIQTTPGKISHSTK